METFVYRAKSPTTGKKYKGEIQSENEKLVRELLISKKLEPIKIEKKSAFNSDLSSLEIFKPRIKLQDITFFCKQFSAMIQAGISIGKGIIMCADQCENISLRDHLYHINAQLSEGKTLSESVREEAIFPPLLENLIECGEASGNLDKVLREAVKHFDNQLGIQKKIKKAMSYPMVVAVITVVVVAILMVKVIPNFADLLLATGAEMPLPTKIVMAVSDFMVAHWVIMLLGVVGIVVGCYLLTRIPAVRQWLDRVSLKLPVFGDLNRKSISATFSSTMSMLVESGIPMLRAMEITKDVIHNSVADEELELALNALRQGQSLFDALSGSSIYPPIMFSMIKSGEETGALDDMLFKISVYFEEEVNIAVDNMTLLIEPAMTIILAIVVGCIVAAVIFPTFAAASAVM